MGENSIRYIQGLERELAYAEQTGDRDKASAIKKQVSAAKKASSNEPERAVAEPAETPEG